MWEIGRQEFDMTELFYDVLKKESEKSGIGLDDGQIEQFFRYYELLIEWNKVMNLTAITEMNDVIIKHFVDSISLIKSEESFGKTAVSVIDVGTGAGFPGIPLKIAFPDIKITLLDSLNKRIKFLGEVVKELDLKDVVMIHGRAEDFGRDPAYREQYDYCVSRAVANLSTLSEYCLAFVKKNGYFISYKSGKVGEELEAAKGAIRKLSGEVVGVTEFSLPDLEAGRSLIKIQKMGILAKKYPRKAGVPSKEPLE